LYSLFPAVKTEHQKQKKINATIRDFIKPPYPRLKHLERHTHRLTPIRIV